MNKKLASILFASLITLSTTFDAYAACRGEIRITCNSGGCVTEIVITCEQP